MESLTSFTVKPNMSLPSLKSNDQYFEDSTTFTYDLVSKPSSSKSFDLEETCQELITYINTLNFDSLTPLEHSEDLQELIKGINEILRKKFFLYDKLIRLYKIGKASGNKGEVWKVFDRQNRAFYAEKIIYNKFNSFDRVALQELKVILKLISADNKSLLRIYRIEYEPGKQYSIMMEYGQGDLNQYLRCMQENNFKWKREEILAMVDQLVNQMKLLKSLDIYHRDIKPANIIITKMDEIKLTDFGISIITSDEEMVQVDPCGTPGYWAPEVEAAFGVGDWLRNCNLWKIDLYAVGKTGERLLSLGLEEEEHLGEFQDMFNKFKEERRIPERTVVQNVKINRARDFLKKFQLNRMMTESQDDQAFDVIESLLKEYIFDEADEWLEEKLKDTPELDRRHPRIISLIAVNFYHRGQLEKSLEYFNRALEGNNKINGEANIEAIHLYNHLALTYNELSRYQEALDSLQKALEIGAQCISDSADISIANTYMDFGNVYYNQARYQDSIRNYDTAEEIFKAIEVENPSIFASLNMHKGNVYKNLAEYAKALQHYDEARVICLDNFGPNYKLLADIYTRIGQVYKIQAKYKEALEEYDKALNINYKILGNNHKIIAGIYQNIGNVYLNQKDFINAENFTRKAIQINFLQLGSSHTVLANNYYSLGNIYNQQDKFEEALEQYKKSLKIYEEKYKNKEHINVANLYQKIGDVYVKTDDYPSALKFIEDALAINMKVVGEKTAAVADCYVVIATIYKRQSLWNQAFEYYIKAMEIQTKLFDSKHPAVLKSFNDLNYFLSKALVSDSHLILKSKKLLDKLVTVDIENSVSTPSNGLVKSFYYSMSDL